MLHQPQPQPVAGPSTSLQNRKHTKRAVIELTDSEDEDRQPAAKRRRRRTNLPAKQNVLIGNQVPGGPSNAATALPSPSLELGNAWNDLSLIDTDVFNASSHSHEGQGQVNASEQKQVLSVDDQLSQVLEIVPDVEPEHALMLIRQYAETYAGATVERVVGELFENSYPKIVSGKGKRKRDNADDPATRLTPEIDYRRTDRPHPNTVAYNVLAHVSLS